MTGSTGRFRRTLLAGATALVVFGAGTSPGAAQTAVPAVAVKPTLPAAQSVSSLPPPLADLYRKSQLPEDALSLVVQELDGPRLMSINGAVPRNPASVMKLVTTWAALSELGPNYTWRTAFMADPGARVDAQGRLPGVLYLRAGGDPQLMFEDLWDLLRELRLRGVKQIKDLVIDRSIFGPVSEDPGAFDGAGDRPYNASPDALMVGFGAMRLLFMPDAVNRQWVPVIDPPVPGIRIEGSVQWSDAVCPGSPVVRTEPLITQQGVTIRISGTAAGSCGEFSLYRLVLDQQELMTSTFRMLWKELGGTFTGTVRNGLVPPDAITLAVHDSPPLADTIRVINKRSNNVMARTLLLTLGAERGTRPATVGPSGAVAARVLADQGVPMPELSIDNGAGLSRDARVSANSLAAMLDTAWRSPLMPEFMSSLAISGIDGTMRRRMRNESTQGMAHLKSGSLRDVRAIAGYVLGASGKRYVVVSVVNHDRSDAVRAFDDALIKWLAER